MVTVSQLKGWKPEQLQEIAATLRQRQQVLIRSGDDFGKVMPIDGWTGEAANGASVAHTQLLGQLDTMTAGVSLVIKGLDQASDAIPPVQREVENLESLAQKYSYKVADDGSVCDQLAGKPLPPDLHRRPRQSQAANSRWHRAGAARRGGYRSRSGYGVTPVGAR